ncbi:ABC transporter permease [Legionella quateirensis]|uniref:ABC transport system permease n=1 Tax=Legionella quateirensis TaxID=45072 RepID=A0A378KS39_9GAMM|nr:ABC transporter permease [Legionella quateirensis]KTD52859.1 putative ABC transport system permease [Legionella quateirensis]STY16411.1 ABC transport system permease [Legionella quateirensis]
MYAFNRTGVHFIRFFKSIFFFLSFIGHLSHSIKNIITRHLTISWQNVWKILYYSGVTLVTPLIIICALMTMSLSINSYTILRNFNIQDKALSIAQTLLIQDILPIIIGFVLCVQVSLNIINARIKITKLQRSPQEVILEYILPIIIGVNITGLLLYTYLIIIIFLSMYLTFHNVFNMSNYIFLLDLERTTTLFAFTYSVAKTLLYCSIVSFTAGYYYYMVATRHVPLRKAVSRILTRGSLWLTISSFSIKFLNL